MKKIFSKLLIGGLALLSLAACSDDDFNEKYTDPFKNIDCWCAASFSPPFFGKATLG